MVLATAQGLQDTMISGVNEVIPIACLREITATLPTTAAALGRVEHMTRHRMTNYQEVILSVTKGKLGGARREEARRKSLLTQRLLQEESL